MKRDRVFLASSIFICSCAVTARLATGSGFVTDGNSVVSVSSAALDGVLGSTPGSVAFRNTSWTSLAPDTDGMVLTLASGIPSWAAPAGGSGWSYSSPAVTLTTTTDHVGIGDSVASNEKFRVLGDSTYKNITLRTGTTDAVIDLRMSDQSAGIYIAGQSYTSLASGAGGAAILTIYGNGDIVLNDNQTSVPHASNSGVVWIPQTDSGAPDGHPSGVSGNAATIISSDFHPYIYNGTLYNATDGYCKTANITAQSGAATIATYTTLAADQDFEVSGQINVTASTALSTSITCTYTDVSSVSRVMILPITNLAGSFLAGGLATGSGANTFETATMHIRAKASTSITLATAAGTFTGVTYSASGCIMRKPQ